MFDLFVCANAPFGGDRRLGERFCDAFVRLELSVDGGAGIFSPGFNEFSVGFCVGTLAILTSPDESLEPSLQQEHVARESEHHASEDALFEQFIQSKSSSGSHVSEYHGSHGLGTRGPGGHGSRTSRASLQAPVALDFNGAD